MLGGASANLTREKALKLSLQYNFVTELTSLIVVEEMVYEEAIMNNMTNYTNQFGSLAGPGVVEDSSSKTQSNSGAPVSALSSALLNMASSSLLLLYLLTFITV